MSTKKIKATATPQTENIPLELMVELHRSFDHFNNHFCQGTLPRPILIVSSNFKKKAHGWFASDAWSLKGEVMSEITLCGESFKNGPDHVLDTLLHEMAHLKNYIDNERKIVDCTPQQRHNQIFQKTAEFFGLEVSSSKRFGSGHTKLGEVAKKVITDLKPRKDLYELYINLQKAKEDEKKKEKKGNLTPVMIDKDVKTAIEEGAKAVGMNQKEFTGDAVKLALSLNERINIAAGEIFGKKFKTIEDLVQVLQTTLTADLSPNLVKPNNVRVVDTKKKDTNESED